LAKDYERKVQTSETLIELAAIRLLLRRLATPVGCQTHRVSEINAASRAA
jgi:hypothetical protein